LTVNLPLIFSADNKIILAWALTRRQHHGTGRTSALALGRRRVGHRPEADLDRQYYRAGPATVSW
jgi:hypothetical protein